MFSITPGRNIQNGFHLNNEDGVTLIELMVYMVISGMLLSAAVMAFMGQNKTYNRQDITAETQQNIRAALSLMVAEIRLAGLTRPKRARNLYPRQKIASPLIIGRIQMETGIMAMKRLLQQSRMISMMHIRTVVQI